MDYEEECSICGAQLDDPNEEYCEQCLRNFPPCDDCSSALGDKLCLDCSAPVCEVCYWENNHGHGIDICYKEIVGGY